MTLCAALSGRKKKNKHHKQPTCCGYFQSARVRWTYFDNWMAQVTPKCTMRRLFLRKRQRVGRAASTSQRVNDTAGQDRLIPVPAFLVHEGRRRCRPCGRDPRKAAESRHSKCHRDSTHRRDISKWCLCKFIENWTDSFASMHRNDAICSNKW